MRTHPLILLCLGGSILAACGDKDTGTGPTDDSGETTGDSGDTDDTGDSPVSISCTYLGSTPTTLPIDADIAVTLTLSCDDPEAAAVDGWTLTLGEETTLAKARVRDGKLELSVEGASTHGLSSGLAGTIAQENPIFQGGPDANQNVLHLNRPVASWTAAVPVPHSEVLSQEGLLSPLLADLSGDGEIDVVGLTCDTSRCALALALGSGDGTYADWQTLPLGTLTGAADETARLTLTDDGVLVFQGQSGAGTLTRVQIGKDGLGESKTTDLTAQLSRYGFTADTVHDVIAVQSKTETSFAVLLSGAAKGSSACDDSDDFALWEPDGTVRIFQGPATCGDLKAGTAATGLLGGPGSGDLPTTADLLVWTATPGGGSTWNFHVWNSSARAPSKDETTFSADLPGVQARDIQLIEAGDIDKDGDSDMLFFATPESAPGYLALLPALSGESWGAPTWLTLDGSGKTRSSGPVPVMSQLTLSGPRRQHKPMAISRGPDPLYHYLVVTTADFSTSVVSARPGGEPLRPMLGLALADVTLSKEGGVHTLPLPGLLGQLAGDGMLGLSTGGLAVVGGGAQVTLPEDPEGDPLQTGELVLVGRGTIGGPAVIARPCLSADSPAPCDTPLLRLGEGSSISISGGDIIFSDSATLSMGDASFRVSSSLTLDGGVRRWEDVTFLRSQPEGDTLDVLVVESGKRLGSVALRQTEATPRLDWSGSSTAFTGVTGSSGGGDHLEWLAGTSADGAVVLAEISLEALVDAATSGDDYSLETVAQLGDAVSAAPPRGPRVLGSWLDAPGVYLPEARAVAIVKEGAGTAADLVAVIGDSSATCPWRTVLIPGTADSLSAAIAQQITLSSSSQADCADLETPILAADVLGTGQPQLLTQQWDGETLTLAIYFRQDGTLYRRDFPPLTIRKRIDKSTPLLLSAGDLNGDGLQDLFVDAQLEVLGGGSGVWLSDGGRFDTWDTPMEVPFAGYERAFLGASTTTSGTDGVGGPPAELLPGIREVRQD